MLRMIILSFLFLALINCQYISRGNKYFHNPYKPGSYRFPPNRMDYNNDNRYNVHNIDETYNKFKTNNENPDNFQYYHNNNDKPFKDNWKAIHEKSVPTEQFVEDYSEDEYNEPDIEQKIPDSIKSFVDYIKDEQQHDSIGYKDAAKKKLAKLDKQSDSGHKEAKFSAVGGQHEKHLDGKSEAEHKNFKKDAEYSHDRGHGYVKSWSWDRKHIKGNAEGQVTKKLDEVSAGSKGAFGAVDAKAGEAHEHKGLSGLTKESGYSKAGHKDSDQKYTTAGKSNIDKVFPIFG